MGWTGTAHELHYGLMMFNAARDPEGRFILKGGGGVFSFMGAGEEVVIDDDLFCVVNGRDMNVAYLMGQTGYGMTITVI
jgi:hypothetical protein